MVRAIALCALLFTACAVKSEKRYDQMRNALVEGRYDDAVKFIESGKKTFYGENNAVLFYLDKLMAEHLARHYKESNQLVEDATHKMDDLYTKSVSKETGAFLTNDNVLPYHGEDFERALVHVVGALNYAFLGERDEAEVEARRVEDLLQVLNDAHSKEKDGKKSVYSEDAFVRWFSGCLHESDGSDEGYNDAWISYKKALETYEKAYWPKYQTQAPTVLIQDALRTAERLGFDDEYKEIKKKYPTVVYPKQTEIAANGTLVFLHLNGEAPYKAERFWQATADNKIVKVAYPEFVSKPKPIAYAIISVAGQTARTEPMENIDSIAIQNLKDHMGRVKGKMIARAITKFVAAQVADKGTSAATGNSTLGMLAGWGASAAGAATEKADVRSWLLLPASIDATRLFLPPGKYTAKIDFYGQGGGILASKNLPEFAIEKGRTTFMAHRSF